MRIKKIGWIVWDKKGNRLLLRGGMCVFPDKTRAWLTAGKERKNSPYKVIKVNISLPKNYSIENLRLENEQLRTALTRISESKKHTTFETSFMAVRAIAKIALNKTKK